MDYSTTVNLPKTDFPMKADLPKREPTLLAQWEKERVYANALARRADQKGKKQFILHDGPPYANGHLHLGHALNKILKDIIVRYKTMDGYYAPYVPGWDCHGLPIELQLMKELKVDKHKVERQKFREQAAAFAQKFVDIQRQEFKRMGVLGDWERPYLTMSEDYKKAIIDAFEALEAKGYVYRGKKPVYWCSVDETALAEAEVEYENDRGPSIYVAFPSVQKDVYFVIWTTTPWTLPANVAIALNPLEEYVLFQDSKSGKKYIVAEKRLEDLKKIWGLQGKVLENEIVKFDRFWPIQHPWIEGREIKLLPANFVAMDTGTGLVHIAPGHGMEDYQLGQQYHLPVLSPVDDRGRFTEEVPQWKGEHVFKANSLIIKFLKEKGVLLHEEEIAHSYPHCWRCHKPVIFRATEQWFLSIDHESLRSRLLEAINKVEWIPPFGKNRITGMVETRPDWCLSRQRLWGTPIPSQSAPSPLVGEGGDGGAHLGRHLPPPYSSPTPPLRLGGRADDSVARRGEDDSVDILDVWFESGVSWAAVLKSAKGWPELSYPADMYLEGSDQHRGWFQTSLIPSVALEGQAPYRSVLTHGFVMDGQGRPMSKSLGNVISPEELIKQYGADVLRLWVASSDYAGDVRLSPEILKGLTDTYRKVRNTFRYLLANLSDFDPSQNLVTTGKMPEIDRWVLWQLGDLIAYARKKYSEFEFHTVTTKLVAFCAGLLSSFYLDVIKDRLYCDAISSDSRKSARTVLWYLADHLLRLWAPILPFTTSEAWRLLGHRENIHETDFPVAKADWVKNSFQDVLPVREKILEALEQARNKGLIKGNLEAKVVLYSAPDAALELLKRYTPQEWAALLIVSQVEICPQPLKDSAFQVNRIAIRVEHAAGQKCARCWIYKMDVGSHSQWKDVCVRCAQVLEGLAKSGRLVSAEPKE